MASASASVEAFDFYFEPTTVFFERGVEATVTLTNNGSVAHSFTVADLDVEVEVEPGSEASTTFVTPDEPTAYEFFCKFHPEEMTGSLSIGTDETFEDEDLTETDPEETDL
ncbi:MAG: cupredoxin domain-containing protein [Actinomycetota bacterium]|nr:cupredoxin domain-containing protein [Actinomycetota bacterium]